MTKKIIIAELILIAFLFFVYLSKGDTIKTTTLNNTVYEITSDDYTEYMLFSKDGSSISKKVYTDTTTTPEVINYGFTYEVYKNILILTYKKDNATSFIAYYINGDKLCKYEGCSETGSIYKKSSYTFTSDDLESAYEGDI